MREYYEKDFVDDLSFINLQSFPVFYTPDDKYKISVRLNNAYLRFLDCSGLDYSFHDYCRLHLKIWSLYKSDVLRLHLQNPDVPLNEKYDNLEKYKIKHVLYGDPLPVGFTSNMLRVTDPNRFSHVVNRTLKMAEDFHDHIKHRKVSNSILSSLNEEF